MVVNKMLILTSFLRIENLLFIALCMVSIFTRSNSMVEDTISPKWYYSCVLLCAGVILSSLRVLCGKRVSVNIPVCILFVVILCTVQAIYGIIHGYMQTGKIPVCFHITGSFDNPAGYASCLTLSVSFILFALLSVKLSLLKKIFLLSFILVVIAIVLTGSRSGILSLVIITCCWYFGHLAKNRTRNILFSFLLISVVVGCCFFKKDSADGRLLIWKCSLEMIKDAPIPGHGSGGFEAHYMDYQAEYFARNPNDFFAPLADTVQHPFNEYLKILVNYGLIGFLFFLGLAGFSVYLYFLNPTLTGKTALFTLAGLAVFSFFSYPFTYPFTWIIALFSMYILLDNAFPDIKLNPKFSRLISVCLLFIGLYFSYTLSKKIHAEWEWRKLAYKNSPEVVDYYPKLEKVLGDNRYFLYNYAVVLFENNRLEESHRVASQCRKYWADYDLEILFGDIYKQLEDFPAAEYHYTKAYQMCPCRFLPLNFLYDLYMQTGENTKALIIAAEILKKPVKIESLTVKQIKYKMKQALINPED